MNLPKISIVGLGKLGAPLAIVFASRGFEVTGIDINSDTIQSLNAGKIHVFEPDVTELLKKHADHFRATSDFNEISASDITLIIVPTPSSRNGIFLNAFVLDAVKKIGNVLKNKKSFHVISIQSTVVPQSMEKEILPALEKASGKKVGKNIGLCYNPAFVALGSVVRNFLYPDFILIGESDKRSGDKLEEMHKELCMNKPSVKRMNFVNAEITKLALNTYVTTKISYANMLTELCEEIPHANVHTVTDALGNDSRIGHRYLSGGTAYGGPCFPRDNKALTAVGKKVGVTLGIPKITDDINKHQIDRLLAILKKNKGGNHISILGLTYRDNSDVVEEAVGMHLVKKLLKMNYSVSVYDPIGMENAKKILGNKVHYAKNIKSCIESATSIIIATGWPEFKDMKLSGMKRKNPLLIDCWQTIASKTIQKGTRYYALGIGKHT